MVDNTSPLNLTFNGEKLDFVMNVTDITVMFTLFLLDTYIQPIAKSWSCGRISSYLALIILDMPAY